MTEAVPLDASGGTRLVRLLTGLDLASGQVAQERYAERLGELIDLSHSITIAKTLGELSIIAFEPNNESSEAVTGQFLRARYAIVQQVIQSFAPCDDLARIRLPNPGPAPPEDLTEACEPYLQFYRAHQREISFRIQRLQTQVRDAVRGLSPALAQLVALDSVLGDTLSGPCRKRFAAVPKLLNSRIRLLLRDVRQALSIDGSDTGLWPGVHERVCAEMQAMLLAEIEARLQPVLGLIEATNDDMDRQGI